MAQRISMLKLPRTNFDYSLSRLKNENNIDKDLYCAFYNFIQRNQGHRDSVMKARTIGNRLPLNKRFKGCERFDNAFKALINTSGEIR